MLTSSKLAYLEPSEKLSEEIRADAAPHFDARLIREIVHWHHKITSFRGRDAQIVNAARKADWIDAITGLMRMASARIAFERLTAHFGGLAHRPSWGEHACPSSGHLALKAG